MKIFKTPYLHCFPHFIENLVFALFRPQRKNSDNFKRREQEHAGSRRVGNSKPRICKKNPCFQITSLKSQVFQNSVFAKKKVNFNQNTFESKPDIAIGVGVSGRTGGRFKIPYLQVNPLIPKNTFFVKNHEFFKTSYLQEKPLFPNNEFFSLKITSFSKFHICEKES